MTKTGVTHTNTAKGDGRGQLTENPGDKGEAPTPFSGEVAKHKDDKGQGSGEAGTDPDAQG